MTQLNSLIQEVIEFSDLIASHENPADPDLQNACALFSNYLDNQLKEIRRSMIGNPTALSTRWNPHELRQLSDLIKRPTHSPRSCVEWIRTLFQYCISLQRGSMAA